MTNEVYQIVLPDDHTDKIPVSIELSGNDIYLAGYGSSSAICWKNGTEYVLPNSTRATSIFVDGEDVYVAGYQLKNGEYTAKYWKNNTETVFYGSTAECITAVDGDVYVAGLGGIYWKNDTKVILPNGVSANSIVVTSNNALLKKLDVIGQGSLMPEFDPDITNYGINAANNITEINIFAVAASGKNAKVTGNGTHFLDVGNNVIDIIVTASNGIYQGKRILNLTQFKY